jgi:hypothetical protein
MVLLLRSISSSGRMLVMLLFGFGNHVFLGNDFTPFPIRVQQQNIQRKKGLVDEKSLVEKRLKEFEFAMECILQHNNNV